MKYDISIIYVHYNTPKEIEESIRTIRSGVGTFNCEIIIVDNVSEKNFQSPISNFKLPIRTFRNKENIGYGAGLNQGAQIAKGKYLLLVNPDILFAPHSIEKMILRLERDAKIGILGPQIIAPNNVVARSISGAPLLPDAFFIFSFLGKLFPNNKFPKKFWLFDRNIHKEQIVDCIGGACMAVKKETFEKIGGFDKRFFMYFEEIDLSMRMSRAGYKVLYYPEAKIMHFEGQSMDDKNWVQKEFEKSRFKFFKKYHGLASALLAEIFLRATKTENIFLTAILAISSFMNLYQLNPLMLFIGDFGRDYIAARDMILSGKIPLVGIQSSVVWLHQGAISIYLIGLAFLISHFNPIAPAVFYGVIGVFSTYLVFLLGKIYFNNYIGLLSALFYATSPLVIVNARMPYHTSSIPLFASIFFLILYKFLLGKNRLLPLLFFVFGLLLQVELSNAVFLFVLIFIYFFYKPKLKRSDILWIFIGLVSGILPFIIYDITHKFVYTLGFPLWIFNRIRLSLGLTVSGNSTTAHIPGALWRIYQQGSSAIFPISILAVIAVVALVILAVFPTIRNFTQPKNKKALRLILLWLGIPLIGYIFHASPGTAYFPVLFPAISLLLGFTIWYFSKRSKFVIFLFILGCFYNAFLTVKSEYFLFTKNARHFMPPESYGYGYSIDILQDVAKLIVHDAQGREFSIQGGINGKMQTENYEYLIWYEGGKIKQSARLLYVIYDDKKKIPRSEKIIHHNRYLYVVKTVRT